MEVEKDDKESDKRKPVFIKRLLAFVIDMFIVSIVVSLISGFFIDFNKTTELEKKMQNVYSEIYSEKDVEVLTSKFDEYIDISYKLTKYSGVSLFFRVIFTILYFVVFQIYNNGQTIGKKFLNLKVESTNGELSMNQMIFRVFLANSLLLDIITLVFITFASKYVYVYGLVIFGTINYILLAISVFMTMYSKKGLALHDKLFHTRVVEVK